MSPTLWNLQASLERLDQDSSLLIALIDIFHEDSEKLLAKLRAEVEAANHSEARRVAHGLGRLASHFDATRLALVAEEVESRCRDRESLAQTELLRKLDAEVSALRIELTEWKGKATTQRWRRPVPHEPGPSNNADHP